MNEQQVTADMPLTRELLRQMYLTVKFLLRARMYSIEGEGRVETEGYLESLEEWFRRWSEVNV